MGLNDILLVEIGIIAPDVGVAGDGARDVERVVGIGLTDRCFSFLDVRVEIVCGNDLDVLKQEFDELLHSLRCHPGLLDDEVFVVVDDQLHSGTTPTVLRRAHGHSR